MVNKVNKFVYWAPRILSILFILFLALMSLDVFEGNDGFWETILELLLHNIPAFILLIFLLISWKYEIVGGIAFIIAGLAHMVFSVVRVDADPRYVSFLTSLIIDVPVFFIGVLFLIGWFKNKKCKINVKNCKK